METLKVSPNILVLLKVILFLTVMFLLYLLSCYTSTDISPTIYGNNDTTYITWEGW